MIRLREIVADTIRGYLSFQIPREDVDDIAYEERFDDNELGTFGSSVLQAHGYTIWGYERVHGEEGEERFLQYRFEKSIHVNDPPKRL